MDDDPRIVELQQRVDDLERIVHALVELVTARGDHDEAVQRLVRAHRDLMGELERKPRRR